MVQPGRKYSARSGYRYGFNGKELDRDAGAAVYDYGMRIYDGRLGRFFSIDPLTAKYKMLTPYQFASNTPISAIDIDGEEAEVVVDKAAKEMHVNFKYTYNDATEKAMQAAKVTVDDLKKGFEYYFKPDKDGNTQATKNILNNSGMTKEMLEETLGGKIGSGGDGYFNVDYGNSSTYKVFFSVQINKNLDPKKDKTVFTLDAITDTKSHPNNYQDQKGVHLIFESGSTWILALKFGHEEGHQSGSPDVGSDPSERTLQARDIPMVNQFGIKTAQSVGELMESSVPAQNRVLSTETIIRATKKALEKANEFPQNKVTVLTGGCSDVYQDDTQPDKARTDYKPIQKVISKQ